MEGKTGLSVVLLNGSNYPTWKIQCRMVLIRDGVWSIVNGTESAPDSSDADKSAKFMARSDKALATIVLAIDPALLYLLGDPVDPVLVWKTLQDQFQKKTWANKLALRRKLNSLNLEDGNSMTEHIKSMTEVFSELAVIGAPMEDEDKVVTLLASLPDSYNVLVTALEANSEVPKMEIVTERLLHEERKLQDRSRGAQGDGNALMMTAKSRRQRGGPRCYECSEIGHIQRDCPERKNRQQRYEKEKSKYQYRGKKPGHQANKAEARWGSDSSSDEVAGLIAEHVLSTTCKFSNEWIVDSGATCHMCQDDKLFSDINYLENPVEVTLGDGNKVEGTAQGTVTIKVKLQSGKSRKLQLHDVLLVPELSYNLLSVPKAAEYGKTTVFKKSSAEIIDDDGNVVAIAERGGSLYRIQCAASKQKVFMADNEPASELWHQRYGHLSWGRMDKLVRGEMVNDFDYKPGKNNQLCEACTEGKQTRKSFTVKPEITSKAALELVHSDVCGKMDVPSLSGSEYIVTFVDDKTRYAWTYMVKRKSDVFEKFREWRALAEKTVGASLKTLRSDNGGEYISGDFERYLTEEGIRHEYTVPKTPEQNGVAERLNRTLGEKVRCMLSDSGLPKVFWAETFATATYLHNRSPTKPLGGVTPFEAWTGIKPTVGHLRRFGCVTYAHIPKDERSKLDVKSRRCILLGYGTNVKGYRLYDQTRKRVLYSRDVKFDESKRGYCTSPEKNTEMGTEKTVTFDSGDVNVSDDAGGQTQPRRSGRERREPDRFGVRVHLAKSCDSECEPANFREATQSCDQEKWVGAMETEMESLTANEVWDLVELPPDRKVVGSKWVYKVKRDADGNVERYKARLVARGFTQKFGEDYDETFSPVVRFESFRTLVALAAKYKLQLHQMDVTTAFLHGLLKEDVYMKQPDGFVEKGKENLVCKLKRSLYGLKQSPRCWNEALDGKLCEMGFKQTSADPCLYVRSSGGPIYVAVYVDDLVIAAKDEAVISSIKSKLSSYFNMKDMGRLHHFVGMKIVQDDKTGDVWIGQDCYAKDVLQRFGMENCKPAPTPMDPGLKLRAATDDDQIVDPDVYQAAVGSLLYLSVASRPDIAYAVSCAARYTAKPISMHWALVKRILRYLRGTLDLGLRYTGINAEGEFLTAFCDADWAGDLDERKSTSGYVMMLSNGAVSWRSKKQTVIALSTAEAEYVALSAATQEVNWMRKLLDGLGESCPGPTTIHEDNQSAMAIAANPGSHHRTKHIDIKFHYVRHAVQENVIKLKYCPTSEMTADVLTKPVYTDTFSKLRDRLGLVPLDL